MAGIDRKAAIAAYKERKTAAGIFAVRSPTGQVWVGRSQHVDTHRNGLWFALRLGTYPNPGLQAAWNEGDGAFTFEVLERLDDETQPYLRQALLKERLAGWRDDLGAALV
ncbi:GIY-YIG nuclease family protein [Salinarimonas soli]|uniref:GIY-YIG nuclease family protein n=1 Tax=Salinarimonas soli TaxID=1638099 RepID=A0A5B2V9Y0_9HYPH|nr:GIY-YIG nuclease family protein [Salinarimonas soli]KAA2235794.1 GIY-YIG nuclease family protein [Salinarimonas soli]